MTSLYNLLHNADCRPRELVLSPSTFKSVIQAVFDLLREQGISATVIAKLPREAIWYEALEHYRQSQRSASTTYLLKPQTRRPTYSEATEAAARVADDDADHGLYAVEPQASAMTEIWLPKDNPLRRDFFVMVLSPTFQALLLIHRQPKTPAQIVRTAAMDSSAEVMPPSGTQEGKDSFPSVQTFEASHLQTGLNALSRYVEALQLRSTTAHELTPVLEHWFSLSEQMGQWQPDVSLWTSLWTQQIQRQEQLRQTNADLKPKATLAVGLQRTNKILAGAVVRKDEFAKRVGQELRAPLASMKMALSILGSQNLKPSQRKRYIEVISRECDRQNTLINSVLELIHLDALEEHTQMEPVALIDVVPGVVSTYQPLAKEQDVMLAYTIPANLPAVACLGPWLKQIVICLLDNGIKFTEAGGKVWVRAAVKPDYVQLDFEDTGVGIAAKDLPRIFERFYRVRSKTGVEVGAGLGLSVVQQLLQKCGGTIRASSEMGKGTTFQVLLPIYRDK
ncbi:MAG: ATP-binding protein [Cyanobacteria bacterium P01_A01_bin.135]